MAEGGIITEDTYPCPRDAGSDNDAASGTGGSGGGSGDGGSGGEGGSSGEGGADNTGGSAASAFCPGECVPPPPVPWPQYILAWFGPEATPAPEGVATKPVWKGWFDVQLPSSPCQTCACAPPEASCTVPEVWDVHSATCQSLPAGTTTPFDASPGWSGTCNTDNALPPGAMCNGEPCARSLTVEPPILTQTACAPYAVEGPLEGGAVAPIKWKAQAFDIVPLDVPCRLPGDKCLHPHPGYQLCLKGDDFDNEFTDCPDDFPERHLAVPSVVSVPSCTPCTCGSAEGGQCTVQVEAYLDSTCDTVRASTIVASDEQAKCIDLLSGSGLAGKTAAVKSIEPGTCTPTGGELVGELVFGGYPAKGSKPEPATVFCCQPRSFKAYSPDLVRKGVQAGRSP